MKLSTIRSYISKPTDGSMSTRFWAARVPFMLLRLFWYRGIRNPAQERWWRLQWWLHQGDVNSEYWSPVRNEVVTLCSGDRAVVVVPRWSAKDRDSWVRRTRDGQMTVASWTMCMSPGWEEKRDDADGG